MRRRYKSRAEDREPAPKHHVSKSKSKPATGSAAGLPSFLTTTNSNRLHNSPPTAGPGSLADPLTPNRRSVQRVADMRKDAYFRSPVNPTNPVVVWTDGLHLFFSPAGAQTASGRIPDAPEATLQPLPGYTPQEIHWDRVEGIAGGGGALVVILRKPGADDLQIAITNTLEQKSGFVAAAGVATSAARHVTREGSEFVRVDDTNVSVAFSDATDPGEIHKVNFSEGFFRYRGAGGSHDLYVSQGDDPAAYLVERGTGKIKTSFAAGTIATVVAEASGVVSLELNTPSKGGTVEKETITIDLRKPSPSAASAKGHTAEEPGAAAAKTRLQTLGVTIAENGVRLHVNEMEAIEQALGLGGGRGLTALREFRSLIGQTSSDPILEVTKKMGPDNAYGLTDPDAGTPALYIYEPFAATPTDRTTTIRHEMTHVIVDAIEAVERSKLSVQARADLDAALRFEAKRAREKAKGDLLRMGEQGAGDRRPAAGSLSDWRGRISGDVELANHWVELLRRYSFIPDPEGTRELRGVSLADESRYSRSTENTGHPADSVSEFIASFVTCATLYRTQFVADVLAAEAAGNIKGGGGGTYMRGLYRRAWSRIDTRYVPLGANPF
jgi:hypothetical protein